MRIGLLLAAAATASAAALGGTDRVWRRDLDAALRDAGQLDRPVVVHFSAAWCGPCRRMESTLHSPAVLGLLGREAVGVHLDFDRHKNVAQRYGVASIPADVLIAPDGRVLGVMSGYKPAADYARRVSAVADQYANSRDRLRLAKNFPVDPVRAPDPRRGGGRVPEVSLLDPSWDEPPALSAPPPRTPTEEPVLPPADGADGAFGDSDPREYDDFADPDPAPRRTNRPAYRDDLPDPFGAEDPFAVSEPDGGRAPRSVVPPAGAPTGRPRVARRVTRKLLGMRGYCPVTLHESRRWARGESRFSWEHQGVTYFMADAEAFARFVKNAEDYAPRLLGCDPVLYRDEGRAVPGKTEHAAIWRGGLFLFASAETRRTFADAPKAYAASRQVLLIDEIEGIGTF